MRSNQPTFLIVGVMKGSTSAAALNLNKHDSVYCVTGYWKRKVNAFHNVDITQLDGGLGEENSKELDFFNIDKNYEKGLDFYTKYFPIGKPYKGESSPNYFHDNPLISTKRMYECFPNLKIIILLRDPITRTFSHWNMIQKQNPSWGTRFYGLDFENSTKNSPTLNTLLKRSLYSDTLKNYINTFGKSNVYVGLQEQIANNPLEEYNKIFTFLGADNLEKDPGFKKSFVSTYSDSINDNTLVWLKEYFKSDVDNLKELYPNLDYSIWNTY